MTAHPQVWKVETLNIAARKRKRKHRYHDHMWGEESQLEQLNTTVVDGNNGSANFRYDKHARNNIRAAAV
jgi:hypothetical protein